METQVADHAESYDSLMLDHASGGLSPAVGLLVETHLKLSPRGRARAAWIDASGGALLETMEPREVLSAPFPGPVPPSQPFVSADARRTASRVLIEAAARTPEVLSWRWRAPALRELRLPLEGASLVRMAGGRAVPAHDHDGDEITLVLRGEYADETGVYQRGEVAFAGVGVEHSPYVPEGRECVCLVASEGALRFRGLLSQVIYRALS
jgi:putative transcriptional regulator